MTIWVLGAEVHNADVSALEKEIDQIVYRLYGLTEEEIGVVEGKAIGK
jgi:adenine-specific DNA-methyltransferase